MPASVYAYPFGELSVMGSYSKTNFGSNNFATTRRYTAALAYNLTKVTSLELSFMNTDSYVNQDPFQTSTTNEQILALSVLQALLPASMVVQPYVKAGAAQYNRLQKGTIAGIPTREVFTKSPSGVLGGGVRIFLLKTFSLKAEVQTYLADLKLIEAKNNFSIQGGLGWHF